MILLKDLYEGEENVDDIVNYVLFDQSELQSLFEYLPHQEIIIEEDFASFDSQIEDTEQKNEKSIKAPKGRGRQPLPNEMITEKDVTSSDIHIVNTEEENDEPRTNSPRKRGRGRPPILLSGTLLKARKKVFI